MLLLVSKRHLLHACYAWVILIALAGTRSFGSEFYDVIELNPAFNQPALVDTQTTPVQPLTKSISTQAEIAIIIDDMGYSHHNGMNAIALPGELTYAIIPNSPKAEFFAQQAQQHNKEIMLHAPMSNVHNLPLGENGLSETMDENQFKQALQASLSSVPHIRGVNNHMGSLLTQKALPMEWVMQALQEQQLYFIDSRTTSNSIAWQTAQKFNIPSLKRDIFLDHKPDAAFIDQQFKKLVALAKNRGYAVAIGHPYPETLAYLKQHLPQLAKHNIRLVPASRLVFNHSPNLKAHKYTKNVTRITKTLLE